MVDVEGALLVGDNIGSLKMGYRPNNEESNKETCEDKRLGNGSLGN